MNKQEYLKALRSYLAPLPAQEREDLLLDYEAHFDNGLANGRSEAETAAMLGDPLSIAKEVLGPNFNPVLATPPKRDIARMIGVSIVLFFLNIVVVPLLVSLWAVFVSLWAVAVSGCLALILLLVQQIVYDDITVSKVFVAIGMTGIGILMAYFMRYYGTKWIVAVTIGYGRWNERVWTGGSNK